MMKSFTDEYGETRELQPGKQSRFIENMENAGIPWRWYSGRGMYGEKCPAVAIHRDSNHTEHDVQRATKVGLKYDSLGRGSIIYTG